MIGESVSHDGNRFCPASVAESAASCSFGIRTYRKNAELCHCPNVCSTESSTPAMAAVVAAPILKLWPQYWSWATPMLVRLARICFRHGLLGRVQEEWAWEGPPGLYVLKDGCKLGRAQCQSPQPLCLPRVRPGRTWILTGVSGPSWGRVDRPLPPGPMPGLDRCHWA